MSEQPCRGRKFKTFGNALAARKRDYAQVAYRCQTCKAIHAYEVTIRGAGEIRKQRWEGENE